jgi:HTH-type transcriptional regulator/antitoxin HipB
MNIRSPLDLGLIIRQRRRDLGLNQTELASRVGVGRQWIVAIEHGKSRAELGLVLRTLAALNLTLDVDGNREQSKSKDVGLPSVNIDAIINAAKRGHQ